MHFFGDKSDYENMIVNTVIDNRLLLDWIEQQPELDAQRIDVAGYSMGGQASLLLAGVDNRIRNILSIAPPFVDDNIAVTAPKNLVANIARGKVMMITGKRDDVASPEQNQLVFSQIGVADKQHIELDADHILPDSYIDNVKQWF